MRFWLILNDDSSLANLRPGSTAVVQLAWLYESDFPALLHSPGRMREIVAADRATRTPQVIVSEDDTMAAVAAFSDRGGADDLWMQGWVGRPPIDPDRAAGIGRESDLLGAGFSAAPLTEIRILEQTLVERWPVAHCESLEIRAILWPEDLP